MAQLTEAARQMILQSLTGLTAPRQLFVVNDAGDRLTDVGTPDHRPGVLIFHTICNGAAAYVVDQDDEVFYDLQDASFYLCVGDSFSLNLDVTS